MELTSAAAGVAGPAVTVQGAAYLLKADQTWTGADAAFPPTVHVLSAVTQFVIVQLIQL